MRRPVTKPLAGRAGARIVGTIGGTAYRPHLPERPKRRCTQRRCGHTFFAYYQEVPHE